VLHLFIIEKAIEKSLFFDIYFLFEEINKNKYLQSFSQIEVVRAQQKVYFFTILK